MISDNIMVSELLFNAKWALCQKYPGKGQLTFWLHVITLALH